jgi:hypothetical protein
MAGARVRSPGQCPGPRASGPPAALFNAADAGGTSAVPRRASAHYTLLRDGAERRNLIEGLSEET